MLFFQKTPPQTLNQQSESAVSDKLTSLLAILMLNAMLDQTPIATLTIHQLCKYI